MRFRSDRRFLISLDDTGDSDLPGGVVIDLSAGEVDFDLTAYSIYLCDQKWRDPKTVKGALYQICLFREYIDAKKWRVADLTDARLLSYRGERYKRCLKTSGGSKRKAITTVNAGLLAIYPWLRWMQATQKVREGLIGAFPSNIISEQLDVARDSWTTPTLFPGTGGKSRHKLPGFVPEDGSHLAMHELFESSATSEYSFQRNSLFQRIAEKRGLRRGSICSLTIDQFRRENLEACRAMYVDVTPRAQKFGREDNYRLPLALAWDVCNFIETVRADYFEAKGWIGKRDKSRGAIFVSATSGNPIQPRSMTKVFSRAMRALGAPRGSAVHAWRHKFVQDEIRRVTLHRLELGLDTSVDSVAAEVSLAVGHRDKQSLVPYVASVHTRMGLKAA